MSTPRQTLAAQFIADFPEAYKVYAYPYAPAQVGEPVVAVWRTDVDPHPSTPGLLRHTLTVQAYIGPTLGEKAEATADDLLDAVLLSLQRLPAVTVTGSERKVFGDPETGTFQGWTVKCYADSPNVYKQLILEERA